jgi:hypothetical protein
MILRNEKKGKQMTGLIYNQFKKRGSRFKVQSSMLGTGHPERGNAKNYFLLTGFNNSLSGTKRRSTLKL